jgi:hypothetical protein
MEVVHENAFPKSDSYLIDEDFMSNRFYQRPWINIYLENQLDGPFWRKNSAMYQYSNITIPMYLIGGYYDGYIDFSLKIHENAIHSPKIKSVIGPYSHVWPDDASFGSTYNARLDATNWFDYWLKGIENDVKNEKNVTIFVRESHTATDPIVPGKFISTNNWPDPDVHWIHLYPSKDHQLNETIVEENIIHSLKYNPTEGFEGGVHLGRNHEDQSNYDKFSLNYDFKIEKEFNLLGFVDIQLNTSIDSPLVHWIVRIEEVNATTGFVTHICRGMFNGAHKNGRDSPKYWSPNHFNILKFSLRFTSWRFNIGNTMRVSISNSMFPLGIPSPFKTTQFLRINCNNTKISFPVISNEKLNLKSSENFVNIPPKNYGNPPGTEVLSSFTIPYSKCNVLNERRIVNGFGSIKSLIKNLMFNWVIFRWIGFNEKPDEFKWESWAINKIFIQYEHSENDFPSFSFNNCEINEKEFYTTWKPQKFEREVKLQTYILFTGNMTHFSTLVKRTIYENDTIKGTREFLENFVRKFQ